MHPIVAAPLKKLLEQEERLAALRTIDAYFERLGFEISRNYFDLEAACEYYWKGEQPQLGEELLFGYLQH